MSTKGTEKTIKDHPFAFSGQGTPCPYKMVNSCLECYSNTGQALMPPGYQTAKPTEGARRDYNRPLWTNIVSKTVALITYLSQPQVLP
jgi:hypothetical protein